MVQETVHVVPQFQSVDDVIMMSCGYLHETYKPLKRPVGVVLGERGGGRGGRERRGEREGRGGEGEGRREREERGRGVRKDTRKGLALPPGQWQTHGSSLTLSPAGPVGPQ